MGVGPDGSRGYDVMEYAGLWKALQKQQWPSVQRVSVIGPVGDAFAKAALAAAHEVVGREATNMTSEQRIRWQSVRLDVVCASADDVCALHSRLRGLDKVKAVL